MSEDEFSSKLPDDFVNVTGKSLGLWNTLLLEIAGVGHSPILGTPNGSGLLALEDGWNAMERKWNRSQSIMFYHL